MVCYRLTLMVVAGVLTLWSSLARAQSIVAGPLYNAATGYRYYRIAGGDWSQLRAYARAMGGELCAIDNAAENSWIRTNLVGTTSKPFIGLNDATTEGVFVWSSGSNSAYRNWRAGEPSNTAAKDYVRFDGGANGMWEVVAADFSDEAVVKVAGPLRVPEEFPTIEAACNWADAAQFKEVIVAPGTFMLTSQATLNGLKLLGAGAGVTRILGRTGGFDGDIRIGAGGALENVSLIGRGGVVQLWISVGNGSAAVRRCEIQGIDSGPPPIGHTLVLAGGQDGSIIFERCTLTDGGGTLNIGLKSTVSFLNCLLKDTRFLFAGQSSQSVARFNNCTLTRFTSGVNVFDPLTDSRLINTIVNDVAGPVGSFTTPPRCSIFPVPVAGPGNLVGDPRFVDAAAGDFRLRKDSPAIDAGDISGVLNAGLTDFVDFAAQIRVIDVPGVPNALTTAPIDIGAYEYQPSACTADLNSDGVVDDIDFVLFAIQYNAFVCP